MANTYLLRSAVAAATTLGCAVLLWPPPLPYLFCIVFGTATSVLNHATTNSTIKWLDRGAMALGLPITVYYAGLAGPLVAATLYLGAKRTGRIGLHVAAHGILVWAHIRTLTGLHN